MSFMIRTRIAPATLELGNGLPRSNQGGNLKTQIQSPVMKFD